MTATLLDTDIAIHLRDGTGGIAARLATLTTWPSISLITRIELEGGVDAVPAFAERRGAALTRLLASLTIVPLDEAVVDEYARIVRTNGYSRRKVFDRLIAATAIVNDLALVTINARDFRNISMLKLEPWDVR